MPNEYERESPLIPSEHTDHVDLHGLGIGYNMEKKISCMEGGFQLKNVDYEEAIEKRWKASGKAILPYAIYCLENVTVPNSN